MSSGSQVAKLKEREANWKVSEIRKALFKKGLLEKPKPFNGIKAETVQEFMREQCCQSCGGQAGTRQRLVRADDSPLEDFPYLERMKLYFSDRARNHPSHFLVTKRHAWNEARYGECANGAGKEGCTRKAPAPSRRPTAQRRS